MFWVHSDTNGFPWRLRPCLSDSPDVRPRISITIWALLGSDPWLVIKSLSLLLLMLLLILLSDSTRELFRMNVLFGSKQVTVQRRFKLHQKSCDRYQNRRMVLNTDHSASSLSDLLFSVLEDKRSDIIFLLPLLWWFSPSPVSFSFRMLLQLTTRLSIHLSIIQEYAIPPWHPNERLLIRQPGGEDCKKTKDQAPYGIFT